MPVAWRKNYENCSILIWNSIEEIQWLFEKADLSGDDLEKYMTFQNEKRRREWLTVRCALNGITGSEKKVSVRYDQYGKPFVDGYHISISHSHELIAIIISKSGHAGIDIELIQERITRLAEKFMSDQEAEFNPEENRIEKMHVIWGAKEVLFKIYGTGEMIFKTELIVHPFIYADEGTLYASIAKNDFLKKYTINYFKINGFMLTWSVDN